MTLNIKAGLKLISYSTPQRAQVRTDSANIPAWVRPDQAGPGVALVRPFLAVPQLFLRTINFFYIFYIFYGRSLDIMVDHFFITKIREENHGTKNP